LPGAAIIFLLMAVSLLYRPTVFDSFIADDFLYLNWANKVVQHPELLLEKYWRCEQKWSADAAFLLFYRPFFYTVFLLEYKLFGFAARYYHLVNIAIELLSTIIVGLIVISLNESLPNSKRLSNIQIKIWALLSSAFFVLYPLHSEIVNWITSIVDLLVVFFILLSFWCYTQWRIKSNRAYFIVSIMSSVLAFLTKETSVALPLTIFAYELFFCDDISNDAQISTTKINWLKRVKKSLITTLPYWLILSLYFCLRTIVLGDLIAGYPDSVCYPTLAGWLKGLTIIFIPINTLTIGTHSYIFKSWHIVLGTVILLNVIAIFRTKNDSRKIIYFLSIWFLVTLVPALKVFPNVMSSFNGARLAYLGTVPLCVFLAYGLAVLSKNGRISFLARLTTPIFLVLAGTILYTNNLTWAAAGRWTTKVVSEIKGCCQNGVGDPLVYITGLPFSYRGIYCIVPLAGIAQEPILAKDVLHCVRLDGDEFSCSPGFIKDNIEQAAAKRMKLLYWDSSSETLKPVEFSNCNKLRRQWRGEDLRQIMRVSALSGVNQPDVHVLENGTVEIISHEKNNTFIVIELNLPDLPCWYVDFLALRMRFVDMKTLGPYAQIQFLFTNKIARDYSKNYFAYNNCSLSIDLTDKEQKLIFPLRNQAAWCMGGKCSNAKIVLPIKNSLRISELFLPRAIELMPQVKLQTLSYDPPGQIRLDKEYNHRQCITYDACGIKDCTQVILQAVPFARSFDNSNVGLKKSPFIEKRVLNPSGRLYMRRDEFPMETGVFKGRVVAVDKTNRPIGFPSDTFLIFVDS